MTACRDIDRIARPRTRGMPGARVIWLPRLGHAASPGRRAASAGTRPWAHAGDLAAAAMVAAALLPLLALIAASLLALGSPVLVRHGAVGRRGLEFDRYLFADPRMAIAQTRGWHRRLADCGGRLLEASRLRGAPQLLNVMQGAMSLRGPRPVTWQVLEDGDLPWQAVEVYLARCPGLMGPDVRTLASPARRDPARLLRLLMAIKPGAVRHPNLSTPSDAFRGGIDRRDISA